MAGTCSDYLIKLKEICFTAIFQMGVNKTPTQGRARDQGRGGSWARVVFFFFFNLVYNGNPFKYVVKQMKLRM